MKNGPWTHSSPNAQAYPRSDEHFVEPEWVSARLFEEEPFRGKIYDPACGFGRIVTAAIQAGHSAYGSDITDRGWDSTPQDFFAHTDLHDNIVCNPPFALLSAFSHRALTRSRHKVAMLWPVARLNAARWLQDTPLLRIWLLSPRPSMPPGHVITDGGKASGGKTDYCWLVWQNGASNGHPEIRWMCRDEASKP